MLVTSITSKVRSAPILELGQALEGTRKSRCGICRFQNVKFKIPIVELKKHKAIHLKFGNHYSKEIQKTPTHNKCYQTTIVVTFNTNYTLNMVNLDRRCGKCSYPLNQTSNNFKAIINKEVKL